MLLHSSIINSINRDEKCFHGFKSLNNKNHVIFYDLGREFLFNIFALLNKVYILKYRVLFLTNAVLSREHTSNAVVSP